MAKCGKGCMPECEYFTTGGCVSPFNCMYKEESGYINSATSGKIFYTGGMNMTNEEMIENLKCVIADISEQCEQLKAENAELRAKLDRAVELPYERKRLLWGDKDKETLLCPDCLTDIMGGIGDETFVVQCPNCGCFVNSAIEPIEFTAATEARLNELQGGER